MIEYHRSNLSFKKKARIYQAIIEIYHDYFVNNFPLIVFVNNVPMSLKKTPYSKIKNLLPVQKQHSVLPLHAVMRDYSCRSFSQLAGQLFREEHDDKIRMVQFDLSVSMRSYSLLIFPDPSASNRSISSKQGLASSIRRYG